MIMIYTSMLMIFCGFWIFCSTREHLLSTLLSLEFMVLGVFFMLLVGLGYSGFFYSLFYLIMTACEGALGLSVLVVMGRSHGGDYFKSLAVIMS